jgi:2-oxoglutarate dehydrogenase E2 component (dihydrolipoamide succinyltransferase)
MNAIVPIEMPLEQEGAKAVVRAWLKKVGERVAQDEPLVEIETDKVAIEVAAPSAGVLQDILIDVGAEAEAGALLGRISSASDAQALAAPPPVPAAQAAHASVAPPRLSPLVRRLLGQNNLSPDDIVGTGRDGRIRHEDVLQFLEERATEKAPATIIAAHQVNPSPAPKVGTVPHTPMRRAIADRMLHSVTTAPHVTAVFEADLSAISAHRQRHRARFEKAGAPLTFSAYFVRAAAEAMRAAPGVNSRWRDDCLELFEDVNIGVGVSLGDKGLIAPVIERAQALSLLGVAERLTGLTTKARAGRLTAAELKNGTFTISNHGVSGSLFAAPIIISQPQSAILGIGKLEKRVVVRQVDGVDAILIRPMAYVSLTIDHRVLDGHQTNAWLTRFVEILETWPLEEGAA